MNKHFLRSAAAAAQLAVLASLWPGAAGAQTLTSTRTSSFTYYVASDGVLNGLLKSETVEPGDPQLGVVTTYQYDQFGNKSVATVTNEAGASGMAEFTPRTSKSSYETQSVSFAGGTVVSPVGQFATRLENALGRVETRILDPRFGLPISVTDPNGQKVDWELDDLARKVRERRPDGTSTVVHYCTLDGRGLSRSSDSSECAGLSFASDEVLNDAVTFIHSEPQDVGKQKMGPFTRVYSDRAGRTIREVSEAFDGPGQPGGTGALVVKDTQFNAYGAAVLTTQPYFLATGSSTATGSNDRGLSLTEYDTLGRPTVAAVTDITVISGQTTINAGGAGGSVVFGSFGTFQAAITRVSYDGLVTVTTNDLLQTRKEERNIDGKVIRVTDASNAQIAYQHDAVGNLIRTRDALQNLVLVTYDKRGRKTSLNDPDSGLWTYKYDALGQLKEQQSPNQRATTPTATVTTMVYDQLGRMTSRVEPEYTSSWTYDTCSNGVGRLCQSTTTNGVDKKYVFDALGRLQSSRTTITRHPGDPSWATAVSYDLDTGRLATQTYPTGVKIAYVYSDSFSGRRRGHLAQLRLASDNGPVNISPLPAPVGGAPGIASGSAQTPSGAISATGAMLWQSGVVNAWGKAESSSLGNGVTSRAAFDAATGRVARLTAGVGSSTSVLDQVYGWDSINRLTGRADANGDGNTGAVSETFWYDTLNRLTQYQVSAPAIPNLQRTDTLQYNAIGNILFKSDVGIYDYAAFGSDGISVNNSKPHAAKTVVGANAVNYSYDANGNLISVDGGKYRTVSYTSFNLPDSNLGAAGASGSPRYTWQYDEGHQRIRETHVDGSGTRTTWYAHPDNAGGLAFESETAPNGTVNNRHYVSVGGQTIVLVSTGALPTLAAGVTTPPTISSLTLVKVEYWHKDQLGSLISTTDHGGVITARYAYDPFGKRRYTSGTYDPFGTLMVDWVGTANAGTDRGFTGHEHLDDIGIVHMNGRLFDPALGRFMQTDPLVQNPLNLQNYNRYGYCFNNPLNCTDPSGLSFLGDLGDKFSDMASLMREAWRTSPYLKTFVAIAVAAAIGPSPLTVAQGGGLAEVAAAGFVSGAIVTGDLRGATVGAATAVMFFQVGSLKGLNSAERVALHGVVGCVSSAAGGSKCGPGALSAAFSKAVTSTSYMRDVAQNPAGGLLVATVVGGTASVIGGGKFANGAITAAYGYLFNFRAHCRNANDCGISFSTETKELAYGGASLLGDFFKLIRAEALGNRLTALGDLLQAQEEAACGWNTCYGTHDVALGTITAMRLVEKYDAAFEAIYTEVLREHKLGSSNPIPIEVIREVVVRAQDLPGFRDVYGTPDEFIIRLQRRPKP